MPTEEPGRQPAIVEQADQLPQPDNDQTVEGTPPDEKPEDADIADAGMLEDGDS